ncbi:protein of unknown function [Oenococcus oeni]|uniref:hypothetical protein n=1 Tax=Oenococcus oeni TaxID=1247 RepID=UPI00107D67C8|nr:hypothetical protein [Oenococcus oeni]AVI94120.1 hypothetical protein AX764_04410 [Oenococcus oeni]SYV99678.1 hypothetical protein OENI_20065 [Oenococcus oeni]SYW03849.1 hypothetical protein OENI_90003 [Oenococcus oeni]SYW17635.1 hypothetical protein OENI_10303 [Oenococcus oeni]VDC14640.1 protein of unknown function [Oenococcus oeni]
MNKIFITYDGKIDDKEITKFIRAIKRIAGKDNWEPTLSNQFLIKTRLSVGELSARLLEINQNLPFSIVETSEYSVNQTNH